MKVIEYKKGENCKNRLCNNASVCFECVVEQSEMLIGYLYERMDNLEDFILLLMKKLGMEMI